MLELRPSCEHCERGLAPDEPGAAICSYECTFCLDCAQDLLSWVCPNCGGALVPRPPRPGDQLGSAPAATDPVHKRADLANHGAAVAARMAATGHVAHLWEVVVDCADPAALAAFYGRLFSVEPEVRSDDWAYVDPQAKGPLLALGGRPARGVRLAFQKVPEPKQGKVRLHIDIGAWDLEAAAAAAVELGAEQLSGRVPDSVGEFIVMADPEGHEFCFVDP